MGYTEDLFSLAKKTAVVTGAGSGLGKAIAEALGRAGAKLLLVGGMAHAWTGRRRSWQRWVSMSRRGPVI